MIDTCRHQTREDANALEGEARTSDVSKCTCFIVPLGELWKRMSTLHVVYEPREIWTRGTGLILGKLIFFLCVFHVQHMQGTMLGFFLLGGGKRITISMRITVDDMNDGK